MRTSEQINELAKALSTMQGNMDAAKQDKVNPFHKSKYADLNSIWDCIRPHLLSNGISVVQDAVTLTEGVSVSTRIMHSSGQWIEFGPLIIPMAKSDAHSTGSAITYSKRYALSCAFGIVSDEDDDGNTAQKNAPIKKEKKTYAHADMDLFIGNWSSLFATDEIKKYINDFANLLKITHQDAVNQIVSKETEFEASFNRWKIQNQND